MNRKLNLLFLILLVCPLLTGKTSADSSSEGSSSQIHCPSIYYVGMVGGIERLTGRRTEGLTETVAGGKVTTSYSLNRRILENSGTVSFMGGMMWRLNPLPIYMGPEFYVGRGSALSSLVDTRPDSTTTNSRVYSTDFQRKLFFGGQLRTGFFFCKNYLASFSFGIDRSFFLTKRVLAFDARAAVSPTLVNRTKGFNGLLFGLGLEKHWNHFLVGLDVKLIRFRSQTNDVSLPIATSPAVSNFTVRPVLYSIGLRMGYKF
ncbi:MAG: hypothetical protein FJX03_00235 [Alphaproteobacteria bacterium]|nr:hypothetical protein [Alphaproteobacteria bacterium]